MSQILTIIGMGKGISMSVARKFAGEGFKIAMIARSAENLKEFKQNLQNEGFEAHYFVADAAKTEALTAALTTIEKTLGATDVLFYNVAKVKKQNILDETAESLADDFKVNVGAALTSVNIVIPAMKDKGKGAILLTGGGLSINPFPAYGSLAIGKAGIRNLALSLSKALQYTGIKVGTVTISGFVNPKDEKYNPDAIAGLFWKLYLQEDEGKETEIVY